MVEDCRLPAGTCDGEERDDLRLAPLSTSLLLLLLLWPTVRLHESPSLSSASSLLLRSPPSSISLLPAADAYLGELSVDRRLAVSTSPRMGAVGMGREERRRELKPGLMPGCCSFPPPPLLLLQLLLLVLPSGDLSGDARLLSTSLVT